MTRNCGRWYLTALALLCLDGHLSTAGLLGGLPDRALHLLLLALLGFALTRAAGRRGWPLALCAWWSAALQWHLAFVPGHEVGVNVWLPDVLAASLGGWLVARPARAASRANKGRPVAVLSEFSR